MENPEKVLWPWKTAIVVFNHQKTSQLEGFWRLFLNLQVTGRSLVSLETVSFREKGFFFESSDYLEKLTSVFLVDSIVSRFFSAQNGRVLAV